MDLAGQPIELVGRAIRLAVRPLAFAVRLIGFGSSDFHLWSTDFRPIGFAAPNQSCLWKLQQLCRWWTGRKSTNAAFFLVTRLKRPLKLHQRCFAACPECTASGIKGWSRADAGIGVELGSAPAQHGLLREYRGLH
mmetsp:Transcript_87453/g.234194  ORF Transcript_87453/g.234194 Transcript_87453/m.234194 type:complete len:136 (+) Transcript_87453:115-522(+)